MHPLAVGPAETVGQPTTQKETTWQSAHQDQFSHLFVTGRSSQLRKICSSNGVGRRQADLLWLTSNTIGLEVTEFFYFLLSKHINSEPQ